MEPKADMCKQEISAHAYKWAQVMEKPAMGTLGEEPGPQ